MSGFAADLVSIPGYYILGTSVTPGNFKVLSAGGAYFPANSFIWLASAFGIESTLRFAPSNFDPSADFPAQSLTATFPGSSLTATNNKFTPASFLAVFDNGSNITNQGYLLSMDVSTFQAITAATSVDDALAAAQQFKHVGFGPSFDWLPTVRTNTGTIRNRVLINGQFYNIYSSFVKDFFTEFLTWSKPLFMELEAKDYSPLFKEFTVWKKAIQIEFEVENYTPMFLEFLTVREPLYMEFSPLSDEEVNILEDGIVLADDCGSATADVSSISLQAGQSFEFSLTRYGEVIDSEENNTSGVLEFILPRDGVYNLQIFIKAQDGSRSVKHNVDYFVDCRTLKCISRIAREDVDSDMCGECKFNPDWKLIYALWYTARMSFAIGKKDETRKAFLALEEHCRECKELRCGCN